MDKFKVKVFVNHKPIGWLRNIEHLVDASGGGRRTAQESVISASLAKATTFCDEAAGEAMAAFVGPERATSKGPEPVCTFQMLRV